MGSTMKVHQFARGLWVHEPPSSLTLGCCKRLRPLAPKLQQYPDTDSISSAAAFDLKSFIRPECGLRKLGSSDENKDSTDHQVAEIVTQLGGTRWNPTQEQIGILEMLYKGGMRTPNAQQIEQITTQLGRYGKIEGKNVFYWFQNHKARERQKQKRSSLGLIHSPRSTPPTITLDITGQVERELEEISPCNKRKSRSWTFGSLEEAGNSSCWKEEGSDKTLELFPLHPEGR